MEIFTEALESVNGKNFKKVNPEGTTREEPRRSWWNENCANLVKKARKLFKAWRKSPLSAEARSDWNKAEARKKKGILTAKKQAWTSFINELGPGDQPRMWAFVKSMTGKGSAPTPDGRPIKINEVISNDPSEKAQAFLNQFSSVHQTSQTTGNMRKRLPGSVNRTHQTPSTTH